MNKIIALLLWCFFLSKIALCQNPSVTLSTLDYGTDKQYNNWRMGQDTFFVVPVKLDSFITGIDSFAFNVVYDPSVMIPMLNIDSVNDAGYIMVQNYLTGLLFPMVDGQTVTADTFSVPNNSQMMTVSFKSAGAFTPAFYSNCQGLLMYLPFIKTAPCDSGTYTIEFWDGFYNAAYVNPMQTHAFVLGGTQTYTVENATMDVNQGSLFFPLFSVALTETTATLESTVANGYSPYTYLWSNGDTTINTNLSLLGTYSLSVTDARGCKASTSFNYTSIALKSVAGSRVLSIQPNPVVTSALIEFEAAPGNNDICLYDFTGHQVWQRTVNTNRTRVFKNDLSPGMYFIHVFTSEGVIKGKLIIE